MVDQDLLQEFPTTDDGYWHEVHLKSQIERNSTLTFEIKTHTSKSVGIGNIRLCNPKGETRVSRWVRKFEEGLPACHLLQYQVQIPESNSSESFDNITDCEEGFFMSDCSENCATLTGTDNCEKYEICLSKGRFQACSCSPGYQGSECHDSCKHGFYGWGCSKKCGKCKNNHSCDKKIGHCRNGCELGYRPPYCRTKYPMLSDGLKIINKTSRNLTFQIDISKHNGDETWTIFILQYRKKGNEEWTSIREQQALQDIKIYVKTIDQLEPYTEYEVRVILTNENVSSSDFEVPFVTENTECAEPSFEICPGQWNVTLKRMLDDKIHEHCSYTIDGVNKNDTLINEIVHGNLHPYKNYSIKICCSMSEWKCVSCINQSFTTHEAASSEPLSLKAHKNEHQVNLTWKYPEEANGKLSSFTVKLLVTHTYLLNVELYENINRTLEQPVSDQEMYSLSFSDLLPSTNYTVMVQAISSVKGKEAHTSFSLPARRPNFTEPVIVDKEITAHSVTIRLPPAALYMTNQSVSFVVVTLLDGDMPIIENSVMNNADLERYIMEPKDFYKGKKAWIAAEIQLKTVSESFVVGETQQCTRNDYGRNYNNPPLSPGSRYQISVVAVNFEDDKILSQYISLMDPVETEGTGNNGLLALLLLLLIPVLILLYRRYYKKKLPSSEAGPVPLHQLNKGYLNHKIEIHDVKVKPRMPLPDTELLSEEESGLKLGTNSATVALPLGQQLSHRVKISNLEQYVNSAVMSGELQRQHSLFPRGPTQPCEYGQLPQNKPKNRYGNLIAYDATRVVLRKNPDDEFSDYINANYIEGYKSQKFYIATQGPKSNTIVDFWRMVWQENVHVICMLTNIVENGKMKCEQYWPELGKEKTHGAVSILNTSEQIFADYTFRCLHVSHEGRKRIIQHLHFTSWPDHGVPFYPQSVASYVKKILVTHEGVGPILVHCSAGVGRTGTIILADINLRMAATESAVDVLYYQQRIRQQRPNLVDNIDQYKLVHFILLECLVEEDSAIPCEGNFKFRIQELRTNGITVRQFQRLRKYNSIQEAQTTEMKELQRLSQRAVHKNRTQNVVQEPRGQIYLTQATLNDPTSAYINAVSVDGFRSKNQFISTQFPLAETVGDFWRMILEKRISLVIILNEIDLGDKSVVEFLPPEERGIYPLPVIEVQQTKMTEHEYWSLHHLQISDISLKGHTQQEPVQVLKFKKWHSGESLPTSPNSLLMLWREAERLYSGTEPILVTCLDGAKACGLFLALTFLVEKVKLEQICDVRQAVQIVCQSRRQFISTQDQFEFLYDAIISYLEGFEIYSNFQ
ncbi:receptor-type tyrosine-protein phosphatase kappa [Anabrus simplex]|uniref:receptor-type tyrosine-protein phosphatase kappa n=1 Tax=Anabrus simplex TaxID=316456 RepID=UPI0035A309B4